MSISALQSFCVHICFSPNSKTLSRDFLHADFPDILAISNIPVYISWDSGYLGALNPTTSYSSVVTIGLCGSEASLNFNFIKLFLSIYNKNNYRGKGTSMIEIRLGLFHY